MKRSAVLPAEFETLMSDPTFKRLIRERLEDAEGTPRALVLRTINACEFAITQLTDAALSGSHVGIHQAADHALAALNELYLALSPEGAG